MADEGVAERAEVFARLLGGAALGEAPVAARGRPPVAPGAPGGLTAIHEHLDVELGGAGVRQILVEVQILPRFPPLL